ncbi:septum site-determining protein MinC [Wenzhouxiangella sp. AB-CW3]|uniref:septum site-determining protein MinC n=1 Tax=Wenzhouxiangella sp. AB-CW3 TaxID=2771012 RepID=UPI00168A96C6|nr:septum site-determining protein MinC [Wenzhouxiangella sp. AB-CW3]QOC22873.1 septum site-determining protein MinC [Wenzhouxiangella sp. AB-CW3]
MSQAAELRFVQLGALALRIHRLDPPAICAELLERRRQAPGMLADAALLLDLPDIDPAPVEEIRELLSALQSQGFIVAGLTAGKTASKLEGMIELPVIGRQTEPRESERQQKSAPGEDSSASTLCIDRPVRSGQQVYARGGDLVVVGNVGAGAELVADGSIHVYGCLRGRALAGARGNRSARVYSLDFRAELVSVAGTYKVFERLPENLSGQPVQAWLDGEQIQLATLIEA